MPEQEDFLNPYRWVHVSQDPQLAPPRYHHRFTGQWGRFCCRLTAITPLFVGAGGKSNSDRFQHVTINGSSVPAVPGTSLKGAFRSIAEIVSGSAVALGKVDRDHGPAAASQGKNAARRLDTVARMFGTLQGDAYLGSIQCSDAPLIDSPESPNQWKLFKVSVGNPNPGHRAFYPNDKARKLYHHHVGGELRTAQSQTRSLRPAPAGSTFEFQVEYRGLSAAELGLLVYSLILEEEAQVELRPEATGLHETTRLRGPLRHKLGGGKASGAGSCRIEITHWRRNLEPSARYRNGRRDFDVLEGETLKPALDSLTAAIRGSEDATMLDLRAMLILDDADPRADKLRYPGNAWFKENPQRKLRPTR